MFKRMLSAFGVGGPSVDTVLDTPHATPGQVVTGQVRIQGGSNDAHIDQVVLSLVTRVEVEHGDHEFAGVSEFLRVVVAQGVRVPAGQPMAVPFQLPVPWETPITAVGGQQLPGMTVGVRTELVISGAPDKGDLDPLLVGPLPSQDRVLDADTLSLSVKAMAARDDATRLAYVEGLADEQGATAACVLAGGRLLRRAWRHRRARADRQRRLLPLPPLARHADRPRREAPQNPALPTPDQRQGV